MKKSKYFFISFISFVCLLLFFFLAIEMIFFRPDIYQIQNETSLTVKEVALSSDTGDIHIYTNEYTGFLCVKENRIKGEKLDRLADLKSGEKIYFRTSQNYKVLDSCYVNTLRTDAYEFISLEDYEEYERKNKIEMNAVLLIVPVTVLFVFILSIIKLRKLSNKT